MIADLSQIFRDAASNMAAAAEGPYLAAVAGAIDVIEQAFRRGGKVLTFGNGGSSADAQHLAAEFVGRFAVARPALPAIALTTNQALLTAWSNDHAFDDVFARQIEALGVAGDVAIGISTSGASRNVLNALAAARERGLRTIGMTGLEGAAHVGPLCDVLLAAPASSTPRIQELHLVTYHAICGAVEQRMLR